MFNELVPQEPSFLKTLVAGFLGISLILYCTFAGADFGAGMLEAFAEKKSSLKGKNIISHAIAPIWEANHVWLILAVVILFNGFPKVFAAFATLFHIPLTLLLIGIVLRGCAFTFRHYDPVQDRSQFLYSTVFIFSSFLSPFMLGTVMGGLFLGSTGKPPTDFLATYVLTWLNPFALAMGGFTCILFAFLAAVYLIGESRNESIRRVFVHHAKVLNILAVITGLMVFGAAEMGEFPLLKQFLMHPFSAASMAAATVILYPLWHSLNERKIAASRVLAAGQIVLVFLGGASLRYPLLIDTPQGPLTVYNAAAPDAVLKSLLYALVFGCAVIFPSLFFLFKTFKTSHQ